MTQPRFGKTNLASMGLFCLDAPGPPAPPGDPRAQPTNCPMGTMCFPPGVTEATLRVISPEDLLRVLDQIRQLRAMNLNVHLLAPVDIAGDIRREARQQLGLPNE